MTKDFKVFRHSWGSEKIITNNDRYCVKDTLLESSPSLENVFYYHKRRDVLFYVIDGKMLLTSVYNGVINEVHLEAGQSYRVNPYIGYKLINITDQTRVIEVSNQYYQDDVYIVAFEDLPKPYKQT